VNSLTTNNLDFTGILNGGILFSGDGVHVYLAMQDTNNRLGISKIEIATWTVVFYRETASGDSRAYSLTFGGS